MNLIFFSRREGKARHLNLAQPVTLTLVGLVAAGLLTGVFAIGMRVGASGALAVVGALAPADLAQQRSEVGNLKEQLQERIDALSMRMGTLNAHLIRLNALGKRVAEMAQIKSSEFDFDRDPPQGGPESEGGGRSADIGDLTENLRQFERRLDLRGAQFTALENVLLGRQLSAEIRPTGRPVSSGYLSSYFGDRMDPFNGEETFHKGVDFAADVGSDVVAVASGIVTWASKKDGYGVLVEVSHGNGLTTRYGHNERVLVKVGDTVQRGQALAAVGSTGRSTGPHVHFEVLKNGRQVDPISFIGR
jgi:murein DD-endopeptidase MepM/ murein hydrolase activator NlpD